MEFNTDSYSYQRAYTFSHYPRALSGCGNGFILALSTRPLSDACTDALRKSFRARGYGENAVTYGVATDNLQKAPQLFQLIEAVDPGILVLADHESINLVQQAYQHTTPIGPVDTVAGRPVIAFSDMEQLMQNQAGKQQIWVAIKSLPVLT